VHWHTQHNTTIHSNMEHKGGSKDLWDAIYRHKTCFVDGIMADSLNAHFASISTDPDPESLEPHLKHTVNVPSVEYVSESSMFNALDILHATAAGLDPNVVSQVGRACFCEVCISVICPYPLL